jgi:hypothetical protein
MKLYKNILNYINYNTDENIFLFAFSFGFFAASIILLIIDINLLSIIASLVLMIISISVNLLNYSSYKDYLKNKRKEEILNHFNVLLFDIIVDRMDYVPYTLSLYVSREAYEAMYNRRHVYGIRIKVDEARKGIDYGFEPKSNYITKVEEFFEYE